MRAIYTDLIKFKNPDGIEYSEMFMELPSKKLYPDYYTVINNPMDMKTINEKIKSNSYKTLEEFVQGKKNLLFSSEYVIKSIVWHFSRNLINVRVNIAPNNSIGRIFVRNQWYEYEQK